jgi:predicted DNA-binding WGR domain protein
MELRALHFLSLDNNSNKYYIIVKDKDNKYTRLWGRMNSDVNSINRACEFAKSVASGGAKPLGAQSSDKFLDSYEIEKLIASKLKKGYKEVSLATKTDVNIIRGEDVTLEDIIAVDTKVQSLLTFIKAEARTSIASFFGGDVAALSQQSIVNARNILGQLDNVVYRVTKVSQNDVRLIKPTATEANELVRGAEAFYNQIPHNLGHKIDKETLIENFVKEIRLGLMEEKLSQLENELSILLSKNNDNKVVATELVSASTREQGYADIVDFMKQSYKDIRIQDIFWTHIPAERAAFEANTFGSENIVPLLHGTHNRNVAHITLQNGLIIPKFAANGSRFGRGIYFSDSAKRSYQYVGGNHNNPKVMFVANVAMGNPWESSGIDERMTEPKQGYHSTWGTGTRSNLGDEIIVYRTQQQSIYALVTLK